MTIQARDVNQRYAIGTSETPRLCPRCGEPMEERKCKIICGNCGTYHDCSDP